MILQDKVIVVTGAAHGIGRALCERFAQERPRGIVVADIDGNEARRVADSIGGEPVICDVRSEQAIIELADRVDSKFGPVDLFCSNAGVICPGGLEVSDDEWRNILDINFMSHLYAVRAVLPSMLERGSGYFLHTASAAGLLTEISSAPYSVTKHAVLALAEWLAITYGRQGIKVSCLCPQGVRTRMLEGHHPMVETLRQTSVSVAEVAECVVAGLQNEQFLILPHPEVAEYFRRKAGDYDRWLAGMQRWREQIGIESFESESTSGM